MKGLYGFLVIAIVLVCVSYANAEVTSAQGDTPTISADIVIVIDRNPKVQEARVYEDNLQIPKHTFKVSTGRETFDTPTNFKRNPYCSFTEKGDFKPTLLRETNFSDTWLTKDNNGQYSNGSEMPHSVFFNGGIALHATHDAAGQARLGPKDEQSNGGSGGCVRLAPEDAQYIFDLMTKKDDKGNYIKMNPTKWEMCTSNPTSTKCTDERQWPVSRNKKTVAIRVVDSRSQEEQNAAKKSCDDKKSRFTQYKAICIKDKIIESKKKSPWSSLFSSDTSANFNFSNEYKALPEDQRAAFNEQCNKDTYFKLKALDKAEAAATGSTPIPMPPKKPQTLSPAPPVPQGAVKTPTSPSEKPTGKANGLWMDYTN